MPSSSVFPAVSTHIQKVGSQILCGRAELSSRDPIDPIKAPVSTDRVTPGGGVGGGAEVVRVTGGR